MERQKKCPNCNRLLTEDELYCYFCEMSLAKLEKENQKRHKKDQSRKNH